uniref:DUF397 domain-containing protein n=1 Tax=Herbidospora sakaeratensis TaxID=564415 RepID=UPI000783D50C|nr:DUF397 domain-containing protein [Herbidospora sakaeratensis]
MTSGNAVWKKSTLSNAGNCVEVARLDEGQVGVRDSKDRNGTALVFTQNEWQAFIGGVKRGEFDQ